MFTQPGSEEPFDDFDHLQEGLSDAKSKLRNFDEVTAIFDF
jgi:hypothetical protein